MVKFGIAKPGNGSGNDFSGTVVELGPGSHNIAVGDRVSSFTGSKMMLTCDHTRC